MEQINNHPNQQQNAAQQQYTAQPQYNPQMYGQQYVPVMPQLPGQTASNVGFIMGIISLGAYALFGLMFSIRFSYYDTKYLLCTLALLPSFGTGVAGCILGLKGFLDSFNAKLSINKAVIALVLSLAGLSISAFPLLYILVNWIH